MSTLFKPTHTGILSFSKKQIKSLIKHTSYIELILLNKSRIPLMIPELQMCASKADLRLVIESDDQSLVMPRSFFKNIEAID